MAAGDIGAIARVHRAACLVAYRFMGWDYPLPQIEAYYGGRFPRWDFARVVEIEGRVVGYLGAAGGWLEDLFIDPAFQGRGIGRTLVMAQLDRGIRPVELEVFEENRPARALYDGFGFRQVKRFWNAEEGAWELIYRLD